MSSKAAKTPTKKTARKAAPANAKAAAKKATVASLSASLKSLETRLKGADTKNRNAVKALESVVADIKASSRKSTTTQKAALTRGLNQLEIRMETYLQRAATKARADVRTELARVTTAGANIATLEDAVRSAHGRLDAMDALQRDSLARLNRHIADLALSVENRISVESTARKADTAALGAKIDSVYKRVDKRIDRVEADTAQALQIVGLKVAEFAAILEKRAESSDAETAERLADLAHETQAEFNSAQTDITTRLEALEVIASAWSPANATPQVVANPYLPANLEDPRNEDSRIDEMGNTIRSLQEELSRMHARIATVQNNDQPPTGAAQGHQPNPAANVFHMAGKTGDTEDNPYAAAAEALGASAAHASTDSSSQADVPNIVDKPRDTHVPQEFDPAAFAATHNTAPQPPTTPSMTLPVAPILTPPTVFEPPVTAPPVAPPMASAGAFAPASTQSKPDLLGADLANYEPLTPAPQPVSTYADPAYAEGGDMRAERIGGEAKKRARLRKLPISGRNVKVGALAVGVAVAGLFAFKTILGGPETNGVEIAATDIQNTIPNTAAAQNPGITETTISESTITETAGALPPPSEPVGQYAETQAPKIVPGQEDTLDAAVAAGNPIAQFQKGLAQLQAGQMKEGARLIRLSANRNQPAAQYRLAKLYETGTGVAEDPITARELIERAARGGNRIAMHDLGNYHAYGQGGLTSDISEALVWFTKAAERGVVDSQFNVAFLSEGNEGVPADVDTALFWYHVAARQGDQGAPERIEILSGALDAAKRAQIKARAEQFNPKPVDEAANGIFRNVAWAKPTSNTTKDKSAQILKIRDAQTLLTDLGYQVGTPDGIAGAKTRSAVKSFEAVNGMPQTGEVTDDLIQKLEIATGA